ncbi:ATP-dependent DNA helicase PIF1, partial [Choanephora cucurbitarum]
MLIKTLYQALVRYYDEDPHRDFNSPTVLLTAPTGKAAYNISDQALHSAFHLPVNHSKITELSADVMHSISVALAELKVAIIDEISMVSSRVFSWVDKRLKDTFNSDKAFGGLHVIIFGEFLQLPPVMGSFIYAKSANTAETLILSLRFQTLWNSFKVFRLTETMRQRDDALFATALNNMALGTMKEENISIFVNRTFPMLPSEAQSSRENKLIQLYSTNNAVAACNEAVLATLNTETFESICFDRVVGN